MSDSPYSRFDAAKLILRDELAIDRTILANERTLLAYLRAGVALLIAGASILHFAGSDWFRWFGIACIPVGFVAGVIGIARYARMAKAISTVRRQAGNRPVGDTGTAD